MEKVGRVDNKKDDQAIAIKTDPEQLNTSTQTTTQRMPTKMTTTGSEH